MCWRRSRHHAGGAQRGRQRSRISNPAAKARTHLTLPPHVPHQIAHSSGPRGTRGRTRGASSSAPRTKRGTSRPPVLPRSKGKGRLPPPLQKEDPGASTSQCPPSSSKAAKGEHAATTFELPFGLRSTAATYASSSSTSLSVYADLLGHHLRSTLDLIATPPVSSYPEDPTLGEDEWAGANFSGLGDPETFMCILEASNYCLGYSDSDDGGYNPS